MAAVRFPKPEVVITQPCIEISLPNLVHLETWPSEDMRTTNPEPEVDSRRQRPPFWKFWWRHNYAADGLIHMKFGVPKQNEILMTIGRLKLKSEVEFQYGGRSFSATGSSYNSAAGWGIFTKFGTLRHPGLLRTCAQPNRNQKLIRDVNGRHLENFNDVINVLPMVWFTLNLVRWRKMRCRWRSVG